MIQCIPQRRSKTVILKSDLWIPLASSLWCPEWMENDRRKDQLFSRCASETRWSQSWRIWCSHYTVNHSVRRAWTSRFMTQCLYRSQEIWPYTTLKDVSKTIQDRSGLSICDWPNIHKHGYFVWIIGSLQVFANHCRSFVAADTLFWPSIATAWWIVYRLFTAVVIRYGQFVTGHGSTWTA